MTEGDLLAYRKRLLDAGISRRIVNRNIRELRDHRDDMASMARQRGLDELTAQADAQHQLGAPGLLAEAMIAYPELRGMLHRFPILLTVLAPPVLMVGVYVLAIALLVAIGSVVHTPGNVVVVPAPAWMEQLLFAFRVFFMHWLTPLFALAFCHCVIRAHVRACYWMVGMLLLCLLGSTVYMHVALPDPPTAREGMIAVSIGYPLAGSLDVVARLVANVLLCGGFVWYGLRRERAMAFT